MRVVPIAGKAWKLNFIKNNVNLMPERVMTHAGLLQPVNSVRLRQLNLHDTA